MLCILLFPLLLHNACAYGQSDTSSSYQVTGNMPSFYKEMKADLTWPEAWGNSAITDFSAWKANARSILFDCMEYMPPAPARYEIEIIGKERREGYSALKIRFNLSEWYRVTAYLLVPDGKGPFPAVLALHDHGAHFTIGKEKLVRPFDVQDEVLSDAENWVRKYYDGVFVGDILARNGYVVLAVDALMWGDRGRQQGPDYDAQQALASNMLQMGSSWGGTIVADDMRSADFLASLECVDTARIGCLGFSMGGYRSWMLAAASERIAASASVCWMCTTGYLMTMNNNQNKGGSAYSMIIPGIRRYMDYPHVAVLACPSPALFISGRNDKLFPAEGVEEAYSIMHRAWDENGYGERLRTLVFDEKHFFSTQMQEEVLAFFRQWL